jgi:hypothetical protein
MFIPSPVFPYLLRKKKLHWDLPFGHIMTLIIILENIVTHFIRPEPMGPGHGRMEI